MIVCTRCGTENVEGTQFCIRCGNYLDWSGVRVAVQEGSAVSASLKNPDVVVDPGGQAACDLDVHNDGRLVDEFRLQVSGPDPQWCSIEPPLLRLMPKTSATARVLFRPPRASNPAAGTTPFVITVSSAVNPSVRSQAAGSLSVRPFTDVSAKISPQTSESVKVAEHTVSLENRGNAAVRVALSAQDADNKMTFELTPADVIVDGGSTAGSHLSVRTTNRKEPRNDRRIAFQINVQPAGSAPIKLDASTVLLQPSVSWWWKWRVAIAAALLLTVAGGVVAFAGPPYPHWPPLPQTSPSAPQPPPVARLAASPTSLSFGTVNVGAGSAAAAVTVANRGTAKATVTPKLSDTTNFSMQDTCSGNELPANAQCLVQVTFTPKKEGSFNGTLNFTSVNADAPSAITLSGLGQGHAVLSCVPPSVAITLSGRTTAPPTSGMESVSCTNTGNGRLTLNSVVLQDATGKFQIQQSCPSALDPGASCTVSVTFTTTTTGTSFAASILFNDSLGQQVVPVTGWRGSFFICVSCRFTAFPTT